MLRTGVPLFIHASCRSQEDKWYVYLIWLTFIIADGGNKRTSGGRIVEGWREDERKREDGTGERHSRSRTAGLMALVSVGLIFSFSQCHGCTSANVLSVSIFQQQIKPCSSSCIPFVQSCIIDGMEGLTSREPPLRSRSSFSHLPPLSSFALLSRSLFVPLKYDFSSP